MQNAQYITYNHYLIHLQNHLLQLIRQQHIEVLRFK